MQILKLSRRILLWVFACVNDSVGSMLNSDLQSQQTLINYPDIQTAGQCNKHSSCIHKAHCYKHVYLFIFSTKDNKKSTFIFNSCFIISHHFISLFQYKIFHLAYFFYLNNLLYIICNKYAM